MTLERDLRDKVRSHILNYKSTKPDSLVLSRIDVLSFIQNRDQILARRRKNLLERAIDDICSELEQKTIEIDEDLNIEKLPQDQLGSLIENRSSGQDGCAAPILETIPKTSQKRKRQNGDLNGPKKALNPDFDARTSAIVPHARSASDVRLKDLGGIDACLSTILETIVLPLSQPQIYARIGISLPRGVLLHGPPGCGKTLLANAIANEVAVPFLAVSAPSIVSGMSGESEKKVRDLFEEAARIAPCLIFIDEIDAVTPKRESAQREMERRIVAQFLTCLDDLTIEKTSGKPVMVIGATNRPDSLDPALRRAGRFDREICLGVPDESARIAILQVLCRKLKVAGTVNIEDLARNTAGFVGADLNALVSAAGVSAIKRVIVEMKNEVGTEDMLSPDQSNDVFMQSRIGDLLRQYTQPLPEEFLHSLAIEQGDFQVALKEVQPSAKREGFTTVPDTTWSDIGALKAVRAELQMAIVQPIRCPELYRAVGIEAPAGVLLWGPPGCGKTLLAKAVANESRANFISIRGPELLNKYVGESERAVRQVFSRARASSPCVIFFDELDALVPRRDDNLSESTSRVVNTLLTELDGLEDRKNVFVIGATNRPDIIDPAMLRPGRLDKPLFVQLPSAAERSDILQALSKRKPLAPDVDLVAIAHDPRASNYSGADLAALMREAGVAALRSMFESVSSTSSSSDINVGAVEITAQNFDVAFTKVRPSVSESQLSRYEKLRVQYSL